MKRRDFIASTAAFAALPVAANAFDETISREPPVPEYLKPEIINVRGKIGPNEIHVIPDHYALYWTLPDGKAIRYYVGVGKDKLYEHGTFYVGAKKAWPGWRPTDEMIARDPGSYKRFEDGMPGGPNNPLGARAIYLFYPGRGDSFLRIHGTNLPRTIGFDVSNGCARLVNRHIVDLYARVPLYSKVVLHPKGRLEKKPIVRIIKKEA
ncbi:MAG: L,D-transpeptidase [Pseudomonadota bacterium]